MSTSINRPPLRGEIYFMKLPSDPPDKGLRPGIIVSFNERNRHPRAETVLVAPMSTSIHKQLSTHIFLSPGETGLSEPSVVKAEELTTVRKDSLQLPRSPLRSISSTKICEIARKVAIAMDCSLP